MHSDEVGSGKGRCLQCLLKSKFDKGCLHPTSKRPVLLCKLKKAMYGLDDSSLLWYKTVEKQKLNLGCIKLQSDPAILYYPHPKDGSLKGLVG